MVPGAGPRQIPAIRRLDVVPARLYVPLGFSAGDISCVWHGFCVRRNGPSVRSTEYKYFLNGD